MVDSVARSLRIVCGHDSRSADGCLNCEAADLIESLRLDDNWRRRAVDELRECHLKIAALAPEASGADYVLVPRYPTRAMEAAGAKFAQPSGASLSCVAVSVYSAMIAAAPINPAPPTSRECVAAKVGPYRVTVAENAVTISEGRKIVFTYDADATPTSGVVLRCPDCSNTSLLYECVACSATNYPQPTPAGESGAEDGPSDVSWWVRRLKVQEAITDRYVARVAELEKDRDGWKRAYDCDVTRLNAKLAEQAAEIERLRETLVRVTNPDESPNLQAEQVGAAESYRAAAIHAIEQRDAAERAKEEACGLLREALPVLLVAESSGIHPARQAHENIGSHIAAFLAANEVKK